MTDNVVEGKPNLLWAAYYQQVESVSSATTASSNSEPVNNVSQPYSHMFVTSDPITPTDIDSAVKRAEIIFAMISPQQTMSNAFAMSTRGSDSKTADDRDGDDNNDNTDSDGEMDELNRLHSRLQHNNDQEEKEADLSQDDTHTTTLPIGRNSNNGNIDVKDNTNNASDWRDTDVDDEKKSPAPSM